MKEKAKKTGQAGQTGGEQPFEESLARLEALVAEMESGELPLDALVKRFEEGRALVERCSAQLDAVKKRMDMVLADGSTAPFEQRKQ